MTRSKPAQRISLKARWASTAITLCGKQQVRQNALRPPAQPGCHWGNKRSQVRLAGRPSATKLRRYLFPRFKRIDEPESLGERMSCQFREYATHPRGAKRFKSIRTNRQRKVRPFHRSQPMGHQVPEIAFAP